MNKTKQGSGEKSHDPGKYGWTPEDDFMPSATEHDSYVLKLPEHILDIAKTGDQLRKYIYHK